MMDGGNNKTKSVMLAGIVFDATNLTEKYPKDLKVCNSNKKIIENGNVIQKLTRRIDCPSTLHTRYVL